MSLTAEQRRALAVLTSAGHNGTSQALLMAHGFSVSMIAGLVNRGLASLTREKVWAGSKLVEAGQARITVAGSEALAAEERFTFTLCGSSSLVSAQGLTRKTDTPAERSTMRTDRVLGHKK
jgi:hypothetical protein